MWYDLLEALTLATPEWLIRKFLPYDPDVLKDSFKPIKKRIHEFAPLYYKHFWADYPETTHLFNQHMSYDELYVRINHFIVFIVENCDNPKAYINFVKHLAKRHKTYGVFDHQFEWVGETHFKVLKIMLGDKFTPDIEKEWRTAFGFIERLMKFSEKFKTREKAPHKKKVASREPPSPRVH